MIISPGPHLPITSGKFFFAIDKNGIKDFLFYLIDENTFLKSLATLNLMSI